MTDCISFSRLLKVLGPLEYASLLIRISSYDAARIAYREKEKAEAKAAKEAQEQAEDREGRARIAERKAATLQRYLRALELRSIGMTYRAVGEQLGVGPARASQLIEHAVRYLKRTDDKLHPLYSAAMAIVEAGYDKNLRNSTKPLAIAPNAMEAGTERQSQR